MPDLLAMSRNLSTYFNAFWKVFKSTIEEERSTFNFKNYSNVDFKMPVVMQPAPALLSSIQKNSKGSFFDQTLFQKINNNSFESRSIDKVWSVFTYDFPFSLGFESDIIRYSWFDWYSVRNTVITKAIDTSVFNLHGAKDYNYSFTGDNSLELLNRTDNFFMKYQFARKLFIPSYIYSPFFFKKHKFGSLFNNGLSGSSTNSFNLFKAEVCVTESLFFDYTLSEQLSNVRISSLESMYSSTVSPIRTYIGSTSIILNQMDILTNLLDILSKKDYIVKSLNASLFNSTTLSSFLKNSSPSLDNPIISTLRVALDSQERTNKYSLKILKDSATRRIFFTDYLDSHAILSKPTNLTLRSQYQPLRKGIVNMIRIQADRAIAMPTDTRLQILAVSKDIIHS